MKVKFTLKGNFKVIKECSVNKTCHRDSICIRSRHVTYLSSFKKYNDHPSLFLRTVKDCTIFLFNLFPISSTTKVLSLYTDISFVNKSLISRILYPIQWLISLQNTITTSWV